MKEIVFYNYLLSGWFLLALVVGVVLHFLPVPYGRHLRPHWGPRLSKTGGWVLMETPAAVVFAVFFALGFRPFTLPLAVFFLFWEAHYFHRSFVCPFLLRGREKNMPLLVVAMGAGFNLVNA